MLPRAKSRVIERDESDNRVAALIPVNSQGEQIGDAQDWAMPAGSNVEPRSSVAVIPDEEPLEETATDRVRAMLSNVGSDATARVQIFRVAPGGGKKLIFVDEMPPDDFERGGLKMIASAYGAGDYEIRLYGATGENGAFGLRSRVRVSVEAAAKNALGSTSDLSSVLQAMQEQTRQLLQTIAEKPAVNPMVQMTEMFTMMKLMREATGDTGGSGNKQDLAGLLTLVKELKGATELFEPAPPADASPFGMVKDMMPIFAAAMQQKATQPAMPVHVPASIAAPPVSLPSNLNHADPFANIMELPMLTIGQKIKLRGTLATLLELAKANVEHEEGATLILDALPDEMLEVLANDEWWDTFAQIVPSAVPFQAWFVGVRDMAIAEYLSEDSDDNTDTSESTGAVARQSAQRIESHGSADAGGVAASGPAPAAPAPAPVATLKRATRAKTAGPSPAGGNGDAPGA